LEKDEITTGRPQYLQMASEVEEGAPHPGHGRSITRKAMTTPRDFLSYLEDEIIRTQ
jgi:hypothetical protein